MSWKLRHEGSPRAIEGLSPGQIAQGLIDGRWEPTDEVMGPQDDRWVALENHPQFAAVAMEVEPPQPKPHDDETRLDMNALIDVCLVLLVFFILTTTYAVLQKLVQAPDTSQQAKEGKVSQQKVDQVMIEVDLRMPPAGGEPIIWVRDKHDASPEKVERAQLVEKLRGFNKKEVLLDPDPSVPFGWVQGVRDDAAVAGKTFVHLKKKVQPKPPAGAAKP